ncbi:glutamate-5-semialdehyde dehydrogenase [Listeria costaricensis]|uniref:glutamate-5-semialdehyde dehydrogenase n=1 Tax=Listeria costaricensis TaxID=2026604 RepID=UPI000C07A058|nr:glutamate-5-semialdehyde dehydrogenase [Listeria costaricensis]
MSELEQKGSAAKAASRALATRTAQEKNAALLYLADQLEDHAQLLLAANEKDLAAAKEKGTAETMLDRLRLTESRIIEIANGTRQVAALKDPVGEVTQMWQNEDNLTIGKKRVPLGAIGIIYESRPNVTVDAAALCFKAGNSVLLRGGSEAFHSNQALVKVIQAALVHQGFPASAVQLVEDTSRETARKMMKLNQYLDVLIPRGGAKLIQTVVQEATVPVIETGTGNCHIYVDEAADLEMAARILVNAKCSRPSVCNAAETLLVHEKVAARFLPMVEQALADFHVELRAEPQAATILSTYVAASEEDFYTEFLDYILAVKVVASLDEATSHINQYGTGHSEAIITNDYFASQQFQNEVDAAAVYVNASTRFTDGFAFGFGAEIGISTQKLHARGPMGLTELTSSKYIILGQGQIRE